MWCRSFGRFVVCMAGLIAEFALVNASPAVQSYLNVAGIPGENPTPGYPNAMQVTAFTIANNQISITKTIDSASPVLFAAVAGGTPLGTANLLMYNDAPAGPPDATLDFSAAIIAPPFTGLCK